MFSVQAVEWIEEDSQCILKGIKDVAGSMQSQICYKFIIN